MEEEPPPTPPPFWLQSTTTRRQRFRPHFPSSSLFLSSGFLVSILCMSAIVFLVLVIPSLLSLTNQVFKPNSVRKSWDSVNLVLVLFAVVCGFLGRNKDYDDQRDRGLEDSFNVATPQSPSRSYQQYSNWYDYEYMVNRSRIHYEFGDQGNVTKLRRTSSSYPDLRQENDSDVEYDHTPRYYDDSYAINAIRPPKSFKSVRSRREFDCDGDESSSDARKVENVTTHIEKEPTPSLQPPPIPGMYFSGESTRARNPPRKEHEPIGRRVRKTKMPPPSLPLPKARSLPPPPPPPAQPPLDRHNSDETRKKSGKVVTKDIPSSIYNQPKRKNKLIKTKSHEDLTDFWSLPPSPLPPTPPPPPSKKLHNIFTSKKAKSGKKITLNSIPHPFAAKSTNFDPMEETSGDGYESPSIPIPPPPPPPPFKLPSWKFPVVHGDYVKITSNPKEADFDESEFEDGTDSSPDVNTKADDFIARFRATLKLEKLNSIKMEGKGVRLSPLGPDSSPIPSPNAMAMTGAI